MAEHQITLLKERRGQAKILCQLGVKSHWILNPPLPRKQNSVYHVPFFCVKSIFVNVRFIPSPTLYPFLISCQFRVATL